MMAMQSLLLTCAFIVQAAVSLPTAETINGTYRGVHLPTWTQDAFLGIPFAQPPIGDLRFRWPQSLNESFADVRNATEYGYSCMQFSETPNEMSEDCLTLNVVRPSEETTYPLPVLVWIYGGGFTKGSTADPQYNFSGIVHVSQEIGQPVIAVSMNYRLNRYGFLHTPELLAEGSTNAGVLDQRLALRWIQENIAAFGGDPSRVVLWGESAGAQSIAYHLFSYDGRDDGLFRGAILESGGPTGSQVQSLPYYKGFVQNMTRAVGCEEETDQLACLRGLSQEDLFAAVPHPDWRSSPIADGEFLTGYPSQLMPEGKFIKVPLLTGTNTDEGISFHPDKPRLNMETDLFHAFTSWREYSLSPPTIRKLLALYPDDPCTAPLFSITNCSRLESPSGGPQWRRSATIGGDLVMTAGRRKMCELYATASQPVWSYRFDQRLWNRSEEEGVQHFDNVAFSFQNISGLLGPEEYEAHARLARVVGEAYIRFVNELDPNPRGDVLEETEDAALNMPYWPKYGVETPVNLVFNASGIYLEDDTYRKDGMDLINSPEVTRELLA